MKRILTLILSLAFVLAGIAAPVSADDTAPTVVNMTPADGSEEVSPVNLKLEAVFSTEMDTSTIDSASVISTPSAVLNVVPKGSKRAVIYMNRNKLSLGETYTIKFRKTIKSASGVELEPAEFSFTLMEQPPQYHQITNGDLEDGNFLGCFADGVDLVNVKLVTDKNNNKYVDVKMGWAEALFMQKVYVESGKTYEARARVKSDIDQDMWFLLNYTTKSAPGEWLHKFGRISVKAGEWTDLTGEIKVASEPINVYSDIRVIGQKEGSTISIDDFQFYEQGFDIEPPSSDGAAGSGDVSVTSIEDVTGDKEYQLLAGLGIYGKKEYSDKSRTVTRENFARYAAVISGNSHNQMTEKAIGAYADIAEGYTGYAGVMANGNMLKADQNGNFNPNAEVTYEEACRALTIALGYSYLLENNTPVAAAAQIGLLKNASAPTHSLITYETLNKILVNVLECKMVAFDDFDGKYPTYKTTELLEKVFDIHTETGIVNATDVTSIDGGGNAGTGYIRIGDKEYEIKYADVSELIGKKVTAYVKGSEGEEWVVYICDTEKYNNILLIDADDIDDFSNNRYSYDDNGEYKKARTAQDKKLIYNYKLLADYGDAKLKPAYGSVELIDNNRDGKYDIIKVLDYQTFVVSSIDYETGIVYDSIEGKSIDLKQDEDLTIINGKATQKIDAIRNGDVLTIVQSSGGEKTVVYRSTNAYVGYANSVNRRNKAQISFYDSVHGKEVRQEYLLVTSYAGTADIKQGDEGTFYIDSFGRIAYLSKETSVWKFGYFIKAQKADTTGEEYAQLKILTAENQIVTFDCADKLSVNTDTRLKNADQIVNTLAKNSQIVQYRLNADGKVNKLITAATTEKNGLRKIFDGKDLEYRNTDKSFAKKMFVNNDTLLFVAPSDVNSADDWEYMSSKAVNYLLSAKSYSFTAYSANEKSNTAQALVIFDIKVKDVNQRVCGAVKEIAQSINDDDELYYEVTVSNNNGEQKIKVKPETLPDIKGTNDTVLGGLKVGDVLNCNTRIDGYATNIRVIYRGSTKTLLTAENPSSASMQVATRSFFGKLTDKEGAAIRLTDSANNYELYNTELYKKIYKYDRAADKLTEITADGLEENISEILAVDAWGTPMLLVVFE